jgi:hypothetical protein
MRVSPTQLHILASLPANGSMIRGALERLPAMREMLAPSFCISLMKYPDPWEIEEVRRRHGLDFAPRAWKNKAA